MGKLAHLPLCRPWYHESLKSASFEAVPLVTRSPQNLATFCASVAGQVDLDRLLAVEAEGPNAGLPQVGDHLARLVRGDVHQVALRVLGAVRLSRCSEIVVGLRRLDAGRAEQVLAVEQAHRAGVLRDRPTRRRWC